MWTATWALNTLISRGKSTDWMVHMLGQAVGGYTNATHGMTLSAVSLPYYRHILPYGLAKFKRFAVNVWDVAPEGKSDREVRRSRPGRYGSMDAGAGPGHETLRPGRNRGNAGRPGRWYCCAPRRLQASLSGGYPPYFPGKPGINTTGYAAAGKGIFFPCGCSFPAIVIVSSLFMILPLRNRSASIII